MNVIQVPSGEEPCPDMVFTANAGVASGKVFIPSHFRYAQRQGEYAAFVRFFKKKGYTISDAAKGHMYFEGEGDLLPYRDLLFGGFQYRSEISAHEKVSAAVEEAADCHARSWSIPYFYHLDTCFFPLDDQTVLYYPGAFDADGRHVDPPFRQKPCGRR